MSVLLVLALAALFTGICYHGRGGSFLGFKHGEYPSLFGLDENGTPYFNYGGTQAARFFWWVLPVTGETYYILSNYTALLYGVSNWHLALIFGAYAVLLFACLLILNHGLYQSMGTNSSNGDSTFMTFFLPQFTMTDPQWKRELIDFTGLTLVGLGRGLLQSVPFLFISLKFLWLAPFAALMGVAYLIGYKVLTRGFGISWFGGQTDMGEFFTGVFYGLGLAAVLLF